MGSNETQLDKLITKYLQFIPQVALKMLALINSVSRGHLPIPDYMLPKFIAPHCTYAIPCTQHSAVIDRLHVTVLKVMWTLLLINKKMYVPRT